VLAAVTIQVLKKERRETLKRLGFMERYE
jgi:hypothetical protein